MSPAGRVYLEEEGHLETFPTEAAGQELNDLQEEPSALQRDLSVAYSCHTEQPSNE